MVAVVIPAYNERYNISRVLSKIPKGRYQVIVVDDGSRDGTANVVKQFGYNPVITKHRGKAHACIQGLKHAKSDLVVFIDGDGQLDPRDIPKIVKLLGKNDLVLGQRNLNKMPWQRKASNKCARKIVKFITGKDFKDVLCGLRGVRKSKMQRMILKEDGYEFEVDTIIEAVRKKMRIATCPVRVSYKTGSRMPKRKSSELFAKLIFKSLKRIVSNRYSK